tara:strand:+ start:23617 stop:24093 length:477 start_codon:yes stop_codon:yes gene_type:complete
MTNPDVDSTGAGSNYSPVTQIHGSGGNWNPPTNLGSTGGGGSGDLDKRVTVLETRVEHILGDITSIKDDVRDMRNIGIGVAITILLGLLGLYVHIGNESKELDDKFDVLNISITNDVNKINNELESISRQNVETNKNIVILEGSINKLVGLNELMNKK